jgi:hypothetical protein
MISHSQTPPHNPIQEKANCKKESIILGMFKDYFINIEEGLQIIFPSNDWQLFHLQDQASRSKFYLRLCNNILN